MFSQVTLVMALFLTLSRAVVSFNPSRTSSAKLRPFNRMLSIRAGALPDTEEGKVMYTLGVNVARQVGGELKGILTPEEMKLMVQGFSDSMAGSVDDEKSLLMKYGPLLNEQLQSRAAKAVDGEKEKGTEYITKYLLNNPTAVKTDSGLVYHETLAGIGAQATADNTVLVHYHGTLPDGTVFDSSVNRGEPIQFPLKNVIRGWQEGVAMMKVGGKATLVVPSDLGYGDAGSPPVIPPGATLTFEVELLDIVSV